MFTGARHWAENGNLQYIGICGRSDYEGFGIFNGKSMVVLTTRLNF